MRIDAFIDRLDDFVPDLKSSARDDLSRGGAIVQHEAQLRIPKITGVMEASIEHRAVGDDAEQIFSNHPGAEVNEQDPRVHKPPRHWLTTSLIDKSRDILELFADSAHTAIRILARE